MHQTEWIRSLRAVRQFSDREIPSDVLRDILDTGRWTGSSKNTQPWDLVVVRNRDTLAALAKWKSLKYVDVQETGTTQEGIEALKKARPEIQILCGPFPPTHPLSEEEPKPVR